MSKMDHPCIKACEAVAKAASNELLKQKQLGKIEDPVDEPIVAVQAALVFVVTVITRTLQESGDAEVRSLLLEEFDKLLKEARRLRRECSEVQEKQERSAWDA